MIKITLFFFCVLFCWTIYVDAGAASFITPCKGTDKGCIIKSAQAAIPKFAAGIPELGVETADPLKIPIAEGDLGDLKIKFTNILLTGTSKCKFVKAERDLTESTMNFDLECPISVVGDYDIKGKVLVLPVEGKDKFKIYTNKIRLSMMVKIDFIDGKDGKKHWNIASWTHSFEALEQVHFEFKNLFNGNKALSDPVDKLLNDNWKEVTEELGSPIVKAMIKKALEIVSSFIHAVPYSQLEIQ